MTAPALESRSTFESSSLYRMLRQRTADLESSLFDHPLVVAVQHAKLSREGYGRLVAALLPIGGSLLDALDSGPFPVPGLECVTARARSCHKALHAELALLLQEIPDLRPVPAARQLADVVTVDRDHLPFTLGRFFAVERTHKMFRRRAAGLGRTLALSTGTDLAIGGSRFEVRPTDEFAECVDSNSELQRHRGDVAIAAQETFEDLRAVLDQLPSA